MDSQDKVLDKSRELWNEFMSIPENELHPDDTNDFIFHLHALQNIMYTQKYKKIEKQKQNTESLLNYIFDSNK